MQVWHFSEMAYHPGWKELGNSLRNVIPSRVYDPKLGADLYHRYLDEWALCDELGINIMVNEHHTTATCTTSVCTIPMAILARETKKIRLLCLGMPIANRMDAVRVAEEYSMIDVISRGRLEMGFVKASPFEVTPANSNPATLQERFWEAHDLILKAMTTHDGPFNWEGDHFQYRQVNVWPRPYQEPHPPVWMTVSSPGSAKLVGEKGYVIASLNTGYAATPTIFDTYRKSAKAAGHEPSPDRFAYLAIVGVGETEDERDSGKAEAVVGRQLTGSLPTGEGVAEKVTVAYEPVWAIGTGRTPTVDDIGAMHRHIRAKLVSIYGEEGEGIRILYGGSVKPDNAAELLAADEVGGALVGGASLTAESFLGIIVAAAEGQDDKS